MKKANIYLLSFFVVFLVLGMSSYVQAIPVRFWGTANVGDGYAPSGTSVGVYTEGGNLIKENPVVIISGITYYVLNFDGSGNVFFRIAGVDSNEGLQAVGNGGSRNLGLSIDALPAPPQPPTSGVTTGGGGGGGGAALSTSCAEKWSCSEWSSCVGGVQTRTCEDSNKCRTVSNKPQESQNCAIPEEITEEIISALPPICNLGARVCAGDDLMECQEGSQWVRLEACEFGCLNENCKEAVSGDGGPPLTGEITGQGGFNGLTGLFTANPAATLYGSIAVIILVLGGLLYWKAKK